MKTSVTLCALSAMLLSTACGSATLGNCVESDNSVTLCTTYTAKGFSSSDEADAQESLASDCPGVFTPDHACSTSGAVGFCSETVAYNNQSITATEVLPNSISASDAQSACAQAGGSYTTTAPLMQSHD